MTRDQLIDLCAQAAYESWSVVERQRIKEMHQMLGGYARGGRRVPLGVQPYEALSLDDRSMWRERARSMVIALERENALKIGGERVWEVEVDDPDMQNAPYVYPAIAAWSPWAAAYEGARRAVNEDPTHGLPGSLRPDDDPFRFPVFLPVATDVPMPIPPALIECVVSYTKVWPAGGRARGDKAILVHPNDPWKQDVEADKPATMTP
ncbi:MAG: hypothetical protein ABW167_07680 [Baekduia sp.]